MEQASKFFDLADGEKSHLTSDDVEKPVRYGQINNSRAFLKLYAHPIGEWIEFWPHSPPYFRLKISCYATAVRKLALELMDAVLESLGLDQACLLEKLEEGIQLMAMNCYQTSQHLHDCTFGMPPHSDYGCLTILFQSCEGLEIIDRSNGNWKAVPETPESLHVHIGDHLEVLSNGRYKSVVHRVVYNSRCRRISIASIQGLSMDQKVITAEELVDEKHPTAYKDTSFREFLQYLLSTDYANGVSYIDSLRIFNP